MPTNEMPYYMNKVFDLLSNIHEIIFKNNIYTNLMFYFKEVMAVIF